MSTFDRIFGKLDPVKSGIFVFYCLVFVVLWFMTTKPQPQPGKGPCLRVGDACAKPNGEEGQCALGPCERVRRPPCFRCE